MAPPAHSTDTCIRIIRLERKLVQSPHIKQRVSVVALSFLCKRVSVAALSFLCLRISVALLLCSISQLCAASNEDLDPHHWAIERTLRTQALLETLRGVTAPGRPGTTAVIAARHLMVRAKAHRFDASRLRVPTEPLIALYQTGRLLGRKGREFRKIAIDWLTPPKRRVQLQTDFGATVLKRGDPRFREVTLSFDDGPGPYTSALLDVLAANDIRASFYLVGRNMKRYPEIVRRIVDDGHVIGNHTYSHPKLRRLNNAAISIELNRFAATLQEALGRPYDTDYFRLPFNSGKRSHRIHRLLAGRFRFIVDWSIDSRDWQLKTPENVLPRVLNHPLKKGAILLFHDGPSSKNTAEIIDALIQELRAQDFTLLSMAELLGEDHHTQLRGRLAHALRALEQGQLRYAYRTLLRISREHPKSPLADDALFMAWHLAHEIKEKRETVPPLIARYLSRKYENSPFASALAPAPHATTE